MKGTLAGKRAGIHQWENEWRLWRFNFCGMVWGGEDMMER